jgi:hypothetical protein
MRVIGASIGWFFGPMVSRSKEKHVEQKIETDSLD